MLLFAWGPNLLSPPLHHLSFQDTQMKSACYENIFKSSKTETFNAVSFCVSIILKYLALNLQAQ